MKIHRIFKSLLVIVLMALASPTFATTGEPVVLTEETNEEKLERLHKRLEEIKAMDRAKMSKTERKALKREVREIRDEVKQVSGGVYISLGALLVIILLLILLL